MENWGPYLMLPSVYKKSTGDKIHLCESLDADLLRQELISHCLPLEVTRINNPWLYRKKGTDNWYFIGESDDVENDFVTEWDVSSLPIGTYEITGAMRVRLSDGIEETSIKGKTTIKELHLIK